jgi:hypothetical protein
MISSGHEWELVLDDKRVVGRQFHCIRCGAVFGISNRTDWPSPEATIFLHNSETKPGGENYNCDEFLTLVIMTS